VTVFSSSLSTEKLAPATRCHILRSRCSQFFSAGAMNYKYITETLFQWTVNTGNYSSLSNQNGTNLCLKCTKNAPGPAGGANSLPRLSSRNEGVLLRRTEGRVGGERGRKGGEGIPVKVEVSRIDSECRSRCSWKVVCVGSCSGATGAQTAAGSVARRCSVNTFELLSIAASRSPRHWPSTTPLLGNS